jgi:hypothetical protein
MKKGGRSESLRAEVTFAIIPGRRKKGEGRMKKGGRSVSLRAEVTLALIPGEGRREKEE